MSCESSPSDKNTVVLGCLAQDFVPNSVSFSWKFKNNSMVSSEKFLTFPGVLRDGLWSASSQVVLPSPRVPQGSKDYLECNVQQPKGGKIKTVVVSPRGEPGSAHGRGWEWDQGSPPYAASCGPHPSCLPCSPSPRAQHILTLTCSLLLWFQCQRQPQPRLRPH